MLSAESLFPKINGRVTACGYPNVGELGSWALSGQGHGLAWDSLSLHRPEILSEPSTVSALHLQEFFVVHPMESKVRVVRLMSSSY